MTVEIYSLLVPYQGTNKVYISTVIGLGKGTNKLYITTVIGLGKGTNKLYISTVIGLGKGLISCLSMAVVIYSAY
jgi:hypothetical protein